MGMKPPKNEPNNQQIGTTVTKPNAATSSCNVPGTVTEGKSTEEKGKIPGVVTEPK